VLTSIFNLVFLPFDLKCSYVCQYHEKQSFCLHLEKMYLLLTVVKTSLYRLRKQNQRPVSRCTHLLIIISTVMTGFIVIVVTKTNKARGIS